MSRVTPFPDSLTRELCRLHAVESKALESHDVPTFLHSRLRWCELIITLCPGLEAAAPAVGRRISPLLPEQPAAAPLWKQELRARPLVPIVRRIVTTHRFPAGGTYQTAIEHLACGHTNRALLLVENGRRARRRRCRECAKARLAALLIQESIKFAVPAADTVGTSVRKGGRGEVPEPLSGAGASPPRPCLVKPR